jgi:hypothetical protein
MEQGKLERCGFCGSFFVGTSYLTVGQLNDLPEDVLNNAPLGYCPNAQAEADGHEPQRHQVTRDMAIDAGEPSLEGQWI